MKLKLIYKLALTAAVGLQVSCGGSGGGSDDVAADFVELALAVCAPDPDPGRFSENITHPYWPMPIGSQLVLEGDDDGELIRVEIDVLDETEVVAGVTTRVATETEYEGGELIEISRNFFAQAPDGTLCYYGEDVDDYEDGNIVGHAGEWRAGESGNLPGILLPGMPEAETQFFQESAPGIAEDKSAILEVGVPVTIPLDTYDDSLHVLDWNPLEGDTSADGEDKYYALGRGLVVDDVVELISFQ